MGSTKSKMNKTYKQTLQDRRISFRTISQSATSFNLNYKRAKYSPPFESALLR